MCDFEIAQYLYRVAFLYENIHGSSHKARAYFKAAMALDGYTKDVEKLYKEGSITEVPSIGSSIEKSIGEIISTHHLLLLDELLGDIPESVFDLYEFTNIRRRLLRKLIEYKVYSVPEAKYSLTANTVSFSSSERSDLVEAIRAYDSRRFQYAHVYEIANDLREILLLKGLVSKCGFIGELSIMSDTIQCGEMICCSLVDIDKIVSVIVDTKEFNFKKKDDNSFTVERFSIPFSVFLVSDDDYDRQYKKKRRNVSNVLSKKRIKTIRGDLHLHTDWSDGIHSIEQMRDYAIGMGYEYIAITDHSQSLRPSGMSELDTISQIKKIRELNQASKIKVLSGIEVDINPDGSLDLPDSILKEFDIVIASVHTHMNQGSLLLMDRLAKALSNPYVNILGHPTTRLLGKPGRPTIYRNEMILDFSYLLQLCKKHNVALEMNYFPERFDVKLEYALRAIEAGVKLSIGTDAHSMYHMNCIKYAVDRLRYAGVPKEFILNCYSFDELKFLLGKQNRSELDSDGIELKPKDFSHYFGSITGIINGKTKVVGIDLTGSESKPSGFAILSGVHVETSAVLTDDEMFKKIELAEPEMVSIDSPLSLPEGRCCGNKDCECARHGILRYCERMLRHFNIGVYPCLIDSMVSLTMRGIRLAARLRSQGYNVIESYPGVAQDLLQIPRKKNKKRAGYSGYEPLLNGLRNFGIEDIRQNISHDEADAITSALVGYFYIADKYVGIGNDKEDYLIVPRLETPLTGKGIVIGLVGRIAAGKTTVSEYMRFKYGFDTMRFSKVISELYNVHGRNELQRIGQEIAQDSKRQKELSNYMLHKMEEGQNYIIDGLRQAEDYDNLFSTLGNRFVLASIETSQRTRLKRYIEAHSNITGDIFIEIDKNPVESKIDYIAAKSQYQIHNNKGYSELRSQVDTMVKKLCVNQV